MAYREDHSMRRGQGSLETPARSTRRVRRSSSRGAALTEAAVVIPFLLLMFAGIMYVGKMYETKMLVMKTTKQAAWAYAMCNCGEKGDPTNNVCRASDSITGGKGGSSSGTPSGFDSGTVSKGGSGPGADVATKGFGSSSAQWSQPVVSDVFMGSTTKNMKSQTVVMCNEAPHDGDLKGWLMAAYDSFRKW
jgi:TadE-like protein